MPSPRAVPSLFPFVTATVAIAAALAAQDRRPLAPGRQDGAAAVAVADCKQWLGTLASPGFEGRGTGQDGFRKAADFVRHHFEQLGLEPGTEQGWFQDLPWTQKRPDEATAHLVFRRGDKVVDVAGASLSGMVTQSIAAKGRVVLVPTTADDAIAAADLADKIVVVALPADDQADSDDSRQRRGRSNYPFQTMRALQGKNAAAIVLAQRTAVNSPLQGTSGPAGAGNRAARGSRMFPSAVTFGGADVDALLALAELKTLPDGDHLQELPLDAEINVAVTEAAAPACNVVGIVRGSDPQLQKEFVVVGSHLDHLGRRGGQYFPGADDDGSGTTGVMAVAQMFARAKVRPKRSILFVCFCGEELGLLGSAHFVQHPPIPLASIAAELQMDMIGRDEEEARDGGRLVNKGEKAEDNRNSLHLVGTQKLAPALHELCLHANDTAGFDLEWDQESMFDRSDHANFGKMGVPMAFFFTGLHMDYHQVTDTPDKIHYEKLLRVATYVYDIAFELAQQDARPQIDAELWAKYRGKAVEVPAAPMAAGGEKR